MNLSLRAQFLIDNLDLAAATGVDDARWEHFQLSLWSDDGPYRIETKSRQIAWSWAIAADAVASAILERRDSIFVSINLEESKEKIRYADAIRTNLRVSGAPRLARDTLTEMEFDNGARITSLPAKPVRGRARANVYLDEFAHARDDRQIYIGSLPVTSKGGRLRIGSSPFGASGQFWEIYEEKLRRYPGYRRKATPWWEVYAFCVNVRDARKNAPALTTAQRVDLFGNERIRAIYANMPEEDFRQEYECHLARTKVLMADGYTKRFIDLAIGDELVYNNSGQLSTCKILDFRRIGVRRIIKITTEAGTILEASAGHKIKTREGKASINDASEVGYVFGLPQRGARQLALARLVGYNLGDGTIARRSNKYTKVDGSISVYYYHQASYYSSVKEDLERIADDIVLSGISDRRPNVLFKKGRRAEYDSYQFHVSRGVADKLIDAGCVVGKKTEQDFEIPEWIRTGDKDVQVEFLAALFGAEGSTPRQRSGAKEKLPQSICLKMMKNAESPIFFEQIMTMLEGLGVRATLTQSKERGKISYSVLVHTGLENALIFFSEVGYRYARRKEEAAFLWTYYLMAYRHEGVMRKAQVAGLREQGLSYAKIGGALGISAQGAYNLLNKEIKRSSWGFPVFSEWVSTRYSEGALYLKISDKDSAGEEEVFNITVDSPDHSYLLADGLDNYNCEFVDEVTAWITWEEIRAAQDPDLNCRLVRANDSLTPEVFAAIDATLHDAVTARVEGALAVGVDVGRTRNATEIFVIGMTTVDSYPLRLAITLESMDFDDQLSVLLYMLQRLPIVAMLIDQNGIGRNLAESAALAWPVKVRPVDFTSASKALWATDAKMLISQHKTPLPADRDIAYQLHSIKRIVGAGRNLIFDTERNEKHHADKFWAWALALAGARQGLAYTASQEELEAAFRWN